MELTIANQRIGLRVDTLGAQMKSLALDSREYLWQGDPKYWADQAPTLFPFIGRLAQGQYRYRGRAYPMGIHGFAAGADFTPTCQEAEGLTLTLESSEQTLSQYPLPFRLDITFRLQEETLITTYRVENPGEELLSFAIGGHPGFRVPLEAEETFEDYYLEFSQACQPDRVGFTDDLLLSGTDGPYPLEAGKILPLRHSLFDEDAVILKHMAREVSLCSRRSGRRVRVSYPDMPYLGIWHWPHTDAPYVCLEPWSSLPSRQGIPEEITCRSDFLHLAPGQALETSWSISLF